MALNNLRRWRGWDLMKAITTPTLIVTGERDKYFPRYVFEGVISAIPNAEVYDVGSAKHKVQLERHKAVNRAIRRFIDGKEHASWREASDDNHIDTHRVWLKSYSPATPPTLPIPSQPLHKFLESAAYWVPKQDATIFYGKKLTYAQLDKLVNQFAHALHGLGVFHGDRVMIVLPNIPQMVIAYYAALKVGAVVVLPNPDANAMQIVAQIKQTTPRVFVTLREFEGLINVVQSQPNAPELALADIRQVVSSGVYKRLLIRWTAAGAAPADMTRRPKIGHLMADLMMDAPVEAPSAEVTPADLAVVIYTGGTTDTPKGVKLTHTNLVANAMQTRHWVPDVAYGKEKILSVVPLLHSYGMTSAMNVPILLGATMILLPVFEVEQVLEHIQTYKPTLFPGVPSMYTALNQAPDVRQYGLSSIEACISGGAPLPIEVQEAFEKLTHARLVEGYGLTEASPITHANPIKGERKTGSIGVPLPNTDAKIIDLVTGEDLPPGNIGELVVRGPQVMQGYWGDDSTVNDSDSVVRDGWLYTGDVAVMDADGYFQIISRKRDAITAGDYSVYPRDVEEVLYENNKVMEVAVVGVSTDVGSDQKVKAFVVPRPGTNLSKDELIALCRRRLEPYAVPWDIEFREELPKSFVGKVLRRMLETKDG